MIAPETWVVQRGRPGLAGAADGSPSVRPQANTWLVVASTARSPDGTRAARAWTPWDPLTMSVCEAVVTVPLTSVNRKVTVSRPAVRKRVCNSDVLPSHTALGLPLRYHW